MLLAGQLSQAMWTWVLCRLLSYVNSYRQLAVQYHPDKNLSDPAESERVGGRGAVAFVFPLCLTPRDALPIRSSKSLAKRTPSYRMPKNEAHVRCA